MKTYTESGFTFFTNHECRKGKELEENPNASLLFYWPQLHYQVRIEGTVKRLSEKVSADYFHSRPKASQASAVVSNQSREISSRDELEARQHEVLEKYRGEDQVILKPDHWGGYVHSPTVFEFWHGRSARLHDRIIFTKDTVTAWLQKLGAYSDCHLKTENRRSFMLIIIESGSDINIWLCDSLSSLKELLIDITQHHMQFPTQHKPGNDWVCGNWTV